MKTKTLPAPDLKSIRLLRDLLRDLPAVKHEMPPDHEKVLEEADSLRKSASLSTCDTFNVCFLTGILLAPRPRK